MFLLSILRLQTLFNCSYDSYCVHLFQYFFSGKARGLESGVLTLGTKDPRNRLVPKSIGPGLEQSRYTWQISERQIYQVDSHRIVEIRLR